ncbi:hypothetical protein CERSUDRAFT_88961 [Gelatoporia subvermispora B]|uniref:Uncharacterized protein n=1 Tax=Ceriporiopsis subvermispora (strain B) TaxID=914234 RepID=M2QYJ6_CERS8|nr:hypothetical protein CERSUDRAFT_88961 [Gelatoporia subvermispora B]
MCGVATRVMRKASDVYIRVIYACSAIRWRRRKIERLQCGGKTGRTKRQDGLGLIRSCRAAPRIVAQKLDECTNELLGGAHAPCKCNGDDRRLGMPVRSRVYAVRLLDDVRTERKTGVCSCAWRRAQNGSGAREEEHLGRLAKEGGKTTITRASMQLVMISSP